MCDTHQKEEKIRKILFLDIFKVGENFFFLYKYLLCNKFCIKNLLCCFKQHWIEFRIKKKIAGNAKMILFMHVVLAIEWVRKKNSKKFMETFYENSFLKHKKYFLYFTWHFHRNHVWTWTFECLFFLLFLHTHSDKRERRAKYIYSRWDWIIFNISRLFSAGNASKLLIFMEKKRHKNTFFFSYFYFHSEAVSMFIQENEKVWSVHMTRSLE